MVEGLNINYNFKYREKVSLRLFTELLESGKQIVTVCIPLYLHNMSEKGMFISTIDIRSHDFEHFFNLVTSASEVYDKIHDEDSEILWDDLNKSLNTPIKVTII